MLIVFTESVLLYHFKGLILEIKTRQYKRKKFYSIVMLHSNKRSSSREMKIDLERVGIYTEHDFDTWQIKDEL